jgi:hypothetical protein
MVPRTIGARTAAYQRYDGVKAMKEVKTPEYVRFEE